MRRMPPRMTRATRAAVTRPVTHTGIPSSSRTVSATVLAWTALPVRNEVRISAPAKKAASGFHRGPSPRSM